MRQSDEAWISLEWIHIELDETFSFPGFYHIWTLPHSFHRLICSHHPLDEELLLVYGLDEPDEETPAHQITAKTMPDPASPRGTTAPLGTPARVRAPDGDGAMMTMLEASCLEKHQGDQRFSESLQFLKFTLGWAGRQKEYPCIPVCRFSLFFLGPLIRHLLWKTVNGLQVEAFSWGFSLLNFLMNVGQFTLPVLFVRHGWFAILLIALGSALCAHTALLMSDALVQFTGHKRSRFWYVLA